jgi:ABC-type multidrug transport system ATPase subunit
LPPDPDEPTTGLDPRSRRTTWQIIRGLVAGGVTVFLTIQYLEEADQLADRIALLDHGRLVAEGTADQLKRRIPAATSACSSPTQTGSTRPPAASGRWCATTRRSPCRSPATAARPPATAASTQWSPDQVSQPFDGRQVSLQLREQLGKRLRLPGNRMSPERANL